MNWLSGKARGEERDEVDVRRRLLAEAQVAVELDAEQPAVDEPEEPARPPIAPRALVDVATRGLRGRRLVVVAHLRKAPDAVAEEGRAGAGRTDEEDGLTDRRVDRGDDASHGHRPVPFELLVVAALGARGLPGEPGQVDQADRDRLGPCITGARDVLAAGWEVVERGAFGRRGRGRGVRRSRERRGGGLVGRGRRHRLLSSGSRG